MADRKYNGIMSDRKDNGIGARVLRKEDKRFHHRQRPLYTDDIVEHITNRTQLLYAAHMRMQMCRE